MGDGKRKQGEIIAVVQRITVIWPAVVTGGFWKDQEGGDHWLFHQVGETFQQETESQAMKKEIKVRDSRHWGY